MRADRLLSLMLLLQGRGNLTAGELAGRLNVSERTIYRDVEALTLAGIPIYTQSGANGGIFLDEEYRVSLTGLTVPEIQTLFVQDGIQPLNDLGLGGAAERTLLKLLAALPSIHRGEVERMRQRLYIDTANWFQPAEGVPYLAELQRAVWEDRCLEISYLRRDGELVERQVQAYGLVAKANIWYLVGRAVEDFRTYKISRLRTVRVLEMRFERDVRFDLVEHWKQSSNEYIRQLLASEEPITLLMRMRAEDLWRAEGPDFEQLSLPDEEGWVMVRGHFGAFWDARGFVARHDRIEVMEPHEFREHLAEWGRAWQRIYEA